MSSAADGNRSLSLKRGADERTFRGVALTPSAVQQQAQTEADGSLLRIGSVHANISRSKKARGNASVRSASASMTRPSSARCPRRDANQSLLSASLAVRPTLSERATLVLEHTASHRFDTYFHRPSNDDLVREAHRDMSLREDGRLPKQGNHKLHPDAFPAAAIDNVGAAAIQRERWVDSPVAPTPAETAQDRWQKQADEAKQRRQRLDEKNRRSAQEGFRTSYRLNRNDDLVKAYVREGSLGFFQEPFIKPSDLFSFRGSKEVTDAAITDAQRLAESKRPNQAPPTPRSVSAFFGEDFAAQDDEYRAKFREAVKSHYTPACPVPQEYVSKYRAGRSQSRDRAEDGSTTVVTSSPFTPTRPQSAKQREVRTPAAAANEIEVVTTPIPAAASRPTSAKTQRSTHNATPDASPILLAKTPSRPQSARTRPTSARTADGRPPLIAGTNSNNKPSTPSVPAATTQQQQQQGGGTSTVGPQQSLSVVVVRSPEQSYAGDPRDVHQWVSHVHELQQQQQQ